MIPSIDRGLHWAIIGGTSVLPKGARVALRRGGLAWLQRRMLRDADVVFIRHPKTGGTWLRVMLTHLYAAKYGISQRRVFKTDELYRQDRRLPRFLITNGYLTWERVVADAFARNDPVLEGKKIFFLARHPGDIAVSWHRQYRKRTRGFKRELLEAEMPERRDWQAMERWEFIQRPELGLPALIDYHNFWTEQLSRRENALILRYEDLREDTTATLARLARFLEEDFTLSQLAEAAAFGSVENMRALEHAGYFHNGSGMRLRNADDPETYKVRRAKVGGFREDLEPEQASWVEREIRERCHPLLGYETGTASVQRS